MWKIIGLSLLSLNVFAADVMVKDAWVREAPPTSKTTAAYMQLHNQGQQTVDLLKAESPQFNKVEIHNTIIENNVAKMVEMEKLEIKSQQTVELKPKGLHIMLIEAKSGVAPKAGDTVDLKLFFSNQQVEELKIPVRTSDHSSSNHAHH